MHTLRQLLGTSVQNVPVHLSPSIISGQVLGMKAAIDRYCTRCLEFQQNKHKNPVARAPLQHITATRPYQIIAMDFLGPLPRSNAGNLYITAQFSSVQFSSVQFSSVQFSSVQFSSVQFSSVQFS
eukprot:scpid110178/ scgid22941/ 